MRIYLAGTAHSKGEHDWYYGELMPRLARMGHDVVDPGSLADRAAARAAAALPDGVERLAALRAWALGFAAARRGAIDACDLVFAALDGRVVEPEIAGEIGYAFAVGKTICGLRDDARACSTIEGLALDPVIEAFIVQSGGTLAREVAGIEAAVAEAEALLSRMRGIEQAEAAA